MPTEFHEFLYGSTLAPGQPVTVVGRILTQARAQNAQRDITGLLIFDGLRFCQHVEGPGEAVRSLMARITHDPRHTDIKLMYDGPLVQRRYSRFDMGFAEPDDPDTIEGLHRLDGEPALTRFIGLRPRFDISG